MHRDIRSDRRLGTGDWGAVVELEQVWERLSEALDSRLGHLTPRSSTGCCKLVNMPKADIEAANG